MHFSDDKGHEAFSNSLFSFGKNIPAYSWLSCKDMHLWFIINLIDFCAFGVAEDDCSTAAQLQAFRLQMPFKKAAHRKTASQTDSYLVILSSKTYIFEDCKSGPKTTIIP